MNISSNTSVSENVIFGISETFLEDFRGRAVNFIQDRALLLGVGCITTLAIGAFCYFRTTSDKPIDQKINIVGSKFKYPTPEQINFVNLEEKTLITQPAMYYDLPKDVATYPKLQIITNRDLGVHIVNYTEHKISCGTFTDKNSLSIRIFIDQFPVYDAPHTLSNFNICSPIEIMSLKDRPGLICIQQEYNPQKLIILEKVGKNYIISWEASPKDFGVPLMKQSYIFEFSIKKIDAAIDAAIQARKIFLLILFSHKEDELSAFATLPTDIINYIRIGMLGTNL